MQIKTDDLAETSFPAVTSVQIGH